MNNRIIIKPSLFTCVEFLSLDKTGILNCFKIAGLFATMNSNSINTNIVKFQLGIEELNIFKNIFDVKDDLMWIGDHFNYFKNNLEHVKQNRNNKNNKVVKIIEVNQNLKEEIKDEVDYEEIKNIYNEKMKETNSVLCKKITDKLKTRIKNLYKDNKNDLTDSDGNSIKVSLNEFYNFYIEECSTKDVFKNGVKEWRANFEWLLKNDTYNRISEGYYK